MLKATIVPVNANANAVLPVFRSLGEQLAPYLSKKRTNSTLPRREARIKADVPSSARRLI